MTEIRTETVPLVDGSALRLTVAEPVSAIRGGIVVLHEARGVTDSVRGIVHGLAADGIAPDLMGVIGFDLGGSVALQVAAKRTLGAAVTVGGEKVAATPATGLPSLVDAAPGLTCPWLGIYGEVNGGGPDQEVIRLRDAAASSQVATDVVVYPRRGHRFDDDPDVAAAAW